MLLRPFKRFSECKEKADTDVAECFEEGGLQKSVIDMGDSHGFKAMSKSL